MSAHLPLCLLLVSLLTRHDLDDVPSRRNVNPAGRSTASSSSSCSTFSTANETRASSERPAA